MNRRIVTVVASLLLLLAALAGSWMAPSATSSTGQMAVCTATECDTPLAGSHLEDLRAGALMSDGPAQYGSIDMLDAPAWRVPLALKASAGTPRALPLMPHTAPYLGTLLRPPENTPA